LYKIENVIVEELKRNVDDRGDLWEVFRSDNPNYLKFGQVYVVRSWEPGTIRAFHKHDVMWDYFHILKGAAKFIFAEDGAFIMDMLGPYTDFEKMKTIIASEEKPTLIHVPPNIWHGWMSLRPDTVLLSIASEPYMGENREQEADEERIPYNSFGVDWKVQYK